MKPQMDVNKSILTTANTAKSQRFLSQAALCIRL